MVGGWVGWFVNNQSVGRFINWSVGIEISREERCTEHGEALRRAESIEKSMEKHGAEQETALTRAARSTAEP